MREAAKKIDIPENGYVIVENIYTTFARKVVNFQEANKETDLESVLELIDQGLIKRHSIDKKRPATYYTIGKESLSKMKRLLAKTQRKLADEKAELRRAKSGTSARLDAAANVQILNRRIKNQRQTINYMEV